MAGLRPYPAHRDSGTEWLSDLPAHWPIHRLRDLCELRVSNVDKHSKKHEQPVRLCNYVDVYKNDYIHSRMPFMQATATAEEIERFRLQVGDVLITKDSETWDDIGVPAVVRAADADMVCGYHLALLRPRPDAAQGDFLFRTLQSRPIACQFHVAANGITRYGLSHGAIKSVRLPVPPVAEQAAMARFLGHADRRIQRYVLAKERLIAVLEEQKQAIIHRAVTGQIDIGTGKPYPAYKDSGVAWLGRVPERWTVVALQRATRSRCDGPFGSGLKSSHYTTNGVRVVRLQNIGHGEFKGANAAYISEEHCAALGDHSVAAGDLLIAGLGDNRHPSGRACVAPATILPAMVKADCFRFRLDTDCVDPQFVAHQLTTTAVEASNLLSTGATRQRTNLQTTATRAISFPGVAEQALIVESITRSTSGIRPAAEAAHRQIECMKEYRARLIADVVTGKLDVREAAAALPDQAPA